MRERRFIEYRRYRYAKLAAALVAFATIAYLWQQPLGGRHGGTWLGYTLGGIGAAIILLLLWFGVRKRQYRNAESSCSSHGGSPVRQYSLQLLCQRHPKSV